MMSSVACTSTTLKKLTGKLGQLSLRQPCCSNNTTSVAATSCLKALSGTSVLPISTTTSNMSTATMAAVMKSTTSTTIQFKSCRYNNNNNNFLCSNNFNGNNMIVRTFGSKKSKKNKKGGKKKNAPAQKSKDEENVDKEVEKASLQHEAWVDFQKDIAVDGFETGQILKARVMKKTSSGHQLRQLKPTEMAVMRKQLQRPELADVRSGQLPTLRYSDEETERLLQQAYAAIPERAGKRGTRNLRRQKRRWFLVRKIHKKQKRFRIRAHKNKMLKRSMKVKQVMGIIEDSPRIRERDRNYQEFILQRWMATMPSSSSSSLSPEFASEELEGEEPVFDDVDHDDAGKDDEEEIDDGAKDESDRDEKEQEQEDDDDEKTIKKDKEDAIATSEVDGDDISTGKDEATQAEPSNKQAK